MKKSTLLLMGAALLVPTLSVAREVKTLDGGMPMQRIDNQKTVKNSINRSQLLEHKAKSPKKNSTAKANEISDVIYEAPAGEAKTLARSGEATYASWGQLVQLKYNNQISELVIGDDGDVYMKNPISQYPTDSYIKGTQEGNKILFELPQAVEALSYNGETIYMLVSMLQYSEGKEWYYPCNTPEAAELGLPEIKDEFTITVNEDGSYTMDIDAGKTVIPGMIYSDNFAWTGYSELASEWREFTDTLNPGPGKDAAVADVSVLYGNMGHYAKIAFEGDDVFVQGILPAQPESWIQGKREGDKISFPSGQYVGEDTDYGCYTYFVGTTFEELWDDYYEEWYNYYYYSNALTFDYNEETMTLTTGKNNAMLYNTSDKEITYLQAFIAPMIEKQPAEISPIPQNPYDLVFFDEDMEYFGYSCLSFELPVLNIDNNLLNINDLYYKIYVDGEEFEFDVNEYYELYDNMVLIPYSFTDEYDFIVDGTYHEVYFYFEGADEIGVQLCNVKDGEIVGASEIVTTSTSGVKNVADGNSSYIVSTKYYNMNGQEVSKPTQGVFVKTMKYEDGTIRSFKAIKK